jgi:hypothetical protein
MADKLGSGDMFPQMTLTTTREDILTLPQDIATSFTIVLFYRGHW